MVVHPRCHSSYVKALGGLEPAMADNHDYTSTGFPSGFKESSTGFMEVQESTIASDPMDGAVIPCPGELLMVNDTENFRRSGVGPTQDYIRLIPLDSLLMHDFTQVPVGLIAKTEELIVKRCH